MGLFMGIGSAALAMITIVVVFRSMELTSSANELREKNTTLQRDLKKLQGQLDSQSSKYQKKAQEMAKSGSKTKDQQGRISKLTEELQTERSQGKKNRHKIQELSGELNRIRISREELRNELSQLKEERNHAAAAEIIEEVEEVALAEEAAQVSGEETPAPAAPRKKSLGRLEKELEQARADLDRQDEAFKSMKRRLVETTAAMRIAQRKNEHNRRAYIITQLQLDLLSDENYVLKHGTPPPYAMAEKQAKRAALRPSEDVVEVNHDAAPIELPDVDELEAAREAEREAARLKAEEEAAAAAAEAEALAAAEAEALAAAEAEALAAAEAEEAAATQEAEAEEVAGEAAAEESPSPTVRRRRSRAAAPTAEA